MHDTLLSQHTKVFNLEDNANERNKQHNLKWP